jgi:AcrR family transcriptional regulator
MPRRALSSPADLPDAVIRVVAGSGLQAVSIRAVAREAGVSVGAVQHHFATKDDLLLAAYGRAIDQVVARARALPDPHTHPAEYVRALLRELLPLDARREAELRVALAFSARSIHEPRLAVLYVEGYRALVEAVTDALRRAAPDLDARQEGIRAVALADGLAWHALCASEALRACDAAAILDAHLTRLLASAPSRH